MYVEIKENKLISWCENPYLDYEFVDIDYNTFEPEKYTVIEGVLTDISNTPEYIAEQEAKEAERVSKLTMTALDFIQVLTQIGISREDRVAYLTANPDLDDQLKYCQNVYCGVVCQLCPITIGNVEITQQMVIQAFKLKNGEVI